MAKLTYYAFADLEQRDDDTDLPLFWSNHHGWSDETRASLFSESEILTVARPMGCCVVQVAVDVAIPLDL